MVCFRRSGAFAPRFRLIICVASAQKVKVITRDEQKFSRERASDLYKVFRNYDRSVHPFARAVEYARAVAAAKKERMFARPFVAAMEGHSDAVYCMARNREAMNVALTGSCDGEIRLWDLAMQCVSAPTTDGVDPFR